MSALARAKAGCAVLCLTFGCRNPEAASVGCHSNPTACSAGLSCERSSGSCIDASWAAWPMPNSRLEVVNGAPHLQSYSDLGDGTVLDDVTQLTWQQLTPSAVYTQSEAVAHCAHESLAGHADWRLPTVIELVSIVDTEHYDPSIDLAAFPHTEATSFYWSSTAYAGAEANFWGVYYNNGYEAYNDASLPYSARCVR